MARLHITLLCGAAMTVALLGLGCGEVPASSQDCAPDPETGAHRYRDYTTNTCVLPASEEDARRLAGYERLREMSSLSGTTLLARVRFKRPIRADEFPIFSALSELYVTAVALRVNVGDEQWTVPLRFASSTRFSEIRTAQVADTFLAAADPGPLNADATSAVIRRGEYALLSIVVRADPATLVALIEPTGIVESIVQTADEPWP